MNDTPAPLTPDGRQRHDGIGGTAVAIEGQSWLLADAVPALGLVWDRLYEQNIAIGRYDAADVRMAGARLLLANYDLTPDETAGLILAVEPAALVPAVETALAGPRRDDLVFSQWAISGLIANGIDPGSVPPALLPLVLDHLEASGRVIPRDECLAAIVIARKRQKLLRIAGLNPLPNPLQNNIEKVN